MLPVSIEHGLGGVARIFIANGGRILFQPHEGIASPDGSTYYVAVPNGPHVVVLDGRTFAQKAIVTSPFFTSSRPNKSASPHGIAVTDDGRKVYVGLENADIPGIVVIDTATNRVLKKIDVVLKGGHFLAIQPKTGKLYYPMREDHRVLVLDTRTDKIKEWPVGKWFAPYTASVPDKSGRVYAPSNTSDRVFRLDPKSGELVGYLMPTRDFDVKQVSIDPTNKSTVWMANVRNARIIKIEPLD